MRLEAGKTYKARNGDKIGPMRRAKASEFNDDWPWTVDGNRAWKTNGSYSDIRPVCEYDLIAEWTEGPVRTVTRAIEEKRIEPGSYGRLTVGGRFGDRVHVLVNPEPSYAHKLTATELKAAAAVLLELAGALEE